MDEKRILENLSGTAGNTQKLAERFIPKAEAYLVSNVHKFSSADYNRLLKRELKTMDAAIEVAANIKGASGIRELINGQDKEVGICSLDKGKIPSGEYYAIDKIMLREARTSETNPASVQYVAFGSIEELAALHNAKFSVWADTALVAEFPASDFKTFENDQSHAHIKLRKPFFIKAEQTLEVTIEFPKSTSIPTDTEYHIKVLLEGIKTTKR